jgi:hypothetical protein
MKPRLCVEGDYKAAVKAARSAEHCREHYVSKVLAGVELLKCEVVGVAPVTDARTLASVPTGGTVELDEAESNIAALVSSGAVRVLAKAKPKAQGS